MITLYLINYFVRDEVKAMPGQATLIIGMFFFFGLVLFFIGILGEYIGAIHSQVRKKPMVIEAEKINFEGEQ